MFHYRLETQLPYRSGIGRLLTAVVFLNLVSAVAAAGQTTPVVTVYPFVQVNEMFDDNIQLSPKNRVQDAITNTLLGCDVDFSGDRQVGRFTGLSALQAFAAHPGFNDFGNTDVARFADFIRIDPSNSISLDDSFVRAGASSGLLTAMDPTLSPQFAAALLSNDRSTSNSFDLTIRRDSGELWSTLFRVNQSVFASNTTGQSFAQGIGLSEEYRVSEQARLGLTYELDDMRFSRFVRSQAHFPRAYFDWTPIERLHLRAEAGPIVTEKGGETVSLHPGFQVIGKYSLRRIEFEIDGSQTPTTGASFGGSGLLMMSSGQISYRLSTRTSVHAGASWYRFTGNGIDAQVLSYGAGASRRVSRNLTVFAQCWRAEQSGGLGAGITPTPSSRALIGTFGIRLTLPGIRGAL